MPRSYFPPRTTKEALCIPKTILEKNSGNAMFRITLAKELGQSPDGDAFRRLLTASAGYGLTSGTRQSQKIELEDLGRDVARGDLEAVYQALFSVELFQRFYEYFGADGSTVPSERAAKDFLRNECNIPDRQINNALRGILRNARDWKLIQEISGTEGFVPRELAVEASQLSPDLEPSDLDQSPPPDAARETPLGSAERLGASAKVTPTLQLNIEIHIDADTPDAKIETIFKNMRRYLLTDD